MIVDLTHTLHQGMTVFPGTPELRVQQIASIPFDGFNEKLISFATHTGTHMDAPNHIVPDTATLDMLEPGKFMGKACVIDCRNYHTIDTNVISENKEIINKADFVLFYTSWENLWGTNQYLKDFPVLTKQAASLLTSLNLKGIGLDTISVDPVDSDDLTIHKILLSAGMLIIENLTNLSALPLGKSFDFIALPLKIKDADGSPVRALAII